MTDHIYCVVKDLDLSLYCIEEACLHDFLVILKHLLLTYWRIISSLHEVERRYIFIWRNNIFADVTWQLVRTSSPPPPMWWYSRHGSSIWRDKYHECCCCCCTMNVQIFYHKLNLKLWITVFGMWYESLKTFPLVLVEHHTLKWWWTRCANVTIELCWILNYKYCYRRHYPCNFEETFFRSFQKFWILNIFLDILDVYW